MLETIAVCVAILVVVILLPVLYGFFFGKSMDKEVAERVEQEASPTVLLMIIGVAFCLGGAGIVVYQIYTYLKSGNWEPISTIDALLLFEIQWAMNPTDWLGAWKVLDKIPASVPIFVCGLIVLNDYDKQ